jgi:hypothetical protein
MTELDNELSGSHQRLTDSQRVEVKHTILGVAEEYRIWADIESNLLSVQRHPDQASQLERKKVELNSLFQSLFNLYALYFVAHTTQSSLVNEFSVEYFSAIEPSDCLNAIEPSLQNLTFDQQVAWLFGLSQYLYEQLFGVDSAVKWAILQCRTSIRQVLLFILRHRLNLVYSTPKQRKPGRPAIPLPVHLVRAENQFQQTYFDYLDYCYEHQLAVDKLESLTDKHDSKIPKRIGRPALRPEQKLRNRIAKLNNVLADLSRQSLDTDKPLIETSETRATLRGRKPLTTAQKKQRISKELCLLQQQLSAIENAL